MITRGKTPGRRRNQQLNGGVPRGWRDVVPTVVDAPPCEPQPTALFAIVSTWFDADIIEANVRNCFACGCERVYILDNASPDDTVDRAQNAGALVAKVYETQFYDDDYRIKQQNEFIREMTRAEQRPNLWWLALDADEFPDLDVARLAVAPSQINCVGTNFIDLYPTSPDQYVVGEHPAACLPLGALRWGNVARTGACDHWKHFLVRYSDGNYNLALTRGNHRPAAESRRVAVQEPTWSLKTFHAPFRREEDARARLAALCATGRNRWDDDVTRGQGAVKRWRSLDALYAGRWHEVEVAHTQVFGRPVSGVALYPWRLLVPELVHLQELACDAD